MELPPLLTVKHVMWICGVSKPKATQIMSEPHRKIWKHGANRRIHRDSFLEQLANESKSFLDNAGA